MLALLAAQYRRLDLAEEGLGDAVEAAARTWPAQGTPGNPPAWLLTAARRRIVDRLRSESVATKWLPHLAVDADLSEQAQQVLADGGGSGVSGMGASDERLRLVLLCAHPALPRDAAAALSLRLVMGTSTADIARLFLVSQPTMAARLTRARKRLAAERFEVPTGQALLDRVRAVAEIAYLAFTAGYAPGSGADVVRAEEAGEAVRLARVLRDLVPPDVAAEADLDALLALLLIQHSRRDARVSGGELVLLADQDRTAWHTDEIREALDLLTPLALDAPSTPWLLQALIAAEHAVAPRAADTRWPRIARWYAELAELTQSPVVRLNQAVAVAEADGAPAGLALLETLDPDDLPGHRLPAVRAELLARAGRRAEAVEAYDLALATCANEAELRHLARRRAEVSR